MHAHIIYNMYAALIFLYILVFSCISSVQRDLLNAREGDKEVRELAKSVTMPALIIWGQHDKVRPFN